MTIDQLSCFLMVAEHGSLTKAAEHLYITHSAVSKTITALEDNLGVQLLVRSNRALTLTPAGQLLQDRGAHLLTLFQDLEERVRLMGNTAHGVVSLYVPYLNSLEMLPIYRMMRERYPFITLDIRPCEPMVIGTAVANRHVDVGITFSFAIPGDTPDLESMVLQEDRFYAVVALDHPFARLASVTTEQALAMPLVCPPVINEEFEPSVLSRIVRPYQETDYQAGSLEELVFRVALGREVAIMPGSVFRSLYSNCGCALVPLSNVPERFSMKVIWNRKKTSPALNCFLELAREYIQQQRALPDQNL